MTAQAGALARNRAVQGGAAALLVLVVVIASWSTIFPPKPIEPPPTDTGTPKSAPATPGGQPGGTGGTGARDRRSARRQPAPAPATVPKVTPKVDNGTTPATAKPPVTVAPPVPPGTTTAPTNPKSTGQPAHERRHPAPDAVGRSAAGRLGPERRAPWPSCRQASAHRRSRSPRLRTPGGPDPAPETPRDTTKVTVPPAGSDLVEIAEAEIKRWIAEYTVAYRNRDQAQVRSMNRGSPFRAAQYKAASVTFSNVEIRAREDGQTAVLKADRAVSVRVQPRRPHRPSRRSPSSGRCARRRTGGSPTPDARP